MNRSSCNVGGGLPSSSQSALRLKLCDVLQNVAHPEKNLKPKAIRTLQSLVVEGLTQKASGNQLDAKGKQHYCDPSKGGIPHAAHGQGLQPAWWV